MRNLFKLFILIISIAAFGLVFGCDGEQGEVGPEGTEGIQGDQGPDGDPGPAGQNGIDGEDGEDLYNKPTHYLGSGDNCAQCHQAIYTEFVESGHAAKLSRVVNGMVQPNVDPSVIGIEDFTYRPAELFDSISDEDFEANVGIPKSEISYIVGGYRWQARFLDSDGYLITSGDGSVSDILKPQYVPADESIERPDDVWTEYNDDGDWLTPPESSASIRHQYDCGPCHTTGYTPTGHQDGKPGIVGQWVTPGVQCEACHGPGEEHAISNAPADIVVDRTSQLCGKCHSRGGKNGDAPGPERIETNDGFIRHHGQYDEIFNGKHRVVGCTTCHNPHTQSTTNTVTSVCEYCHWDKPITNFLHSKQADCTDCHLARMSKLSQNSPGGLLGDLRTHIFAINPEDVDPFSDDGATLEIAAVPLRRACATCHESKTTTPLDYAITRYNDGLISIH